MEGVNEMEGLVEICYEEEYGTVCNGGLDMRAAIVVCRQLGFPTERGMNIIRPFTSCCAPITIFMSHMCAVDIATPDSACIVSGFHLGI